jgi:methylenetetrahydrofolate dehydrogenase (NADP+) / methenyltetrahydrofolate cyclohydrolase
VTARVIDGKAIAAQLRAAVAAETRRLAAAQGLVPGLAVVLVGENPASKAYVGSKSRAVIEVGMKPFDFHLPATTGASELLGLIGELNTDAAVHGILVQLPLPPQIDASRIIAAVDPAKDVDGFHPLNAGRLASGLPALAPCTPVGCIKLAKAVHASLSGLDAVVIGRSNIVGKPLVQLLLAENATVTIAHSRTRDLAGLCGRADLLFAAIGRPEFVRGGWIKPGAYRRRRLFRRSRRSRRRDHAGAGRRRADDDRVPARQHAACGLHAGWPAGSRCLRNDNRGRTTDDG